MDVKIINPFLTAVLSTFEQMFNFTAEAKEPFLLDITMGHSWEVTGLLGLTGDAMGVVGFRINRTLAYKLLELSGLTDIKADEKTQMAEQLVSEFTNIVASSAVSNIKDLNISVTPPKTFTGRNHLIPWPKNYPVIGIPFVTKYGTYEVDVCFK